MCENKGIPVPPSVITDVTVIDISTDCVTLYWEPPAGKKQNYIVSCFCGEEVVQELQTDGTSLTIRDLKPGQQYHFSVYAQLKDGRNNESTATSAGSKTTFDDILEGLGLQQHYKDKLSLNKILQIDQKSIIDTQPESNTDVAWYFLKKVMMVNVTARNVDYTSQNNSAGELIDDSVFDLDSLASSLYLDDMIHLLDIVTALFLCSDGFVQQELSLKMSMCQFAVPLLLPNCDTNQCTLMLWALRDIVKKYRPKSLSETKGFKEERIVHSEIPMISFVRLGDCSLSKSKTLNQLLSNSQQYHDFFVHRDMEGGDCPRTISNGLAEITWYLPCGNKNIDIFDEPVAIVNLRGDTASFETQYAFLCQVSSAVFVLFDNVNSEYTHLMTKSRAQIFLVGNQKTNGNSLQEVAKKINLPKSNIILKSKRMNDANFVKILQKTIRNVIEDSKRRMQIEQMANIAHELGIHVDEDRPECQKAKRNAAAITAEIQDTLKFKETHLPRQGKTWKELTSLEKEEFRLQYIGSRNIEDYKSDLQKLKLDLCQKQNNFGISIAMSHFINGLMISSIERSYFLKWMRINLDNLSCEKLSGLREQYKEKSKSSNNKVEFKKIDQQLSNSSLGTEHFFREMGQIYEASVSLPEGDKSRQQFQHLPRLCAQLLLDGFPLELVDGDASNIPLRWVSDVLTQLHELVSPNNKILVVTVLGVQSTGKSTLLNTMFGVQFAVSSGRCTRGAFMLLIKISEDLKTSLNCDFLVIIDTEGLKSPELAQLDDSFEHDNELATLVIGLSDITIINTATENSTEMKDILQIVVHAFLRMKEVGRKPNCQFVHQKVSDVSAHEKNLRERKLLFEQLNEMTQAAAKMERKEKYRSFTDVMEYDPDTGNWYIPGLWNGNPPMAPVNAGYSEAVYELKKNVMHILENHASTANNVLEFREWITSLWNAVKHETFIFNFRNSLVADAYMKLCTEFNKWEWEFMKAMYTWSTNAEVKIKNFGTVAGASQELQQIEELLSDLKRNAMNELEMWETKLLENLVMYFEQKEGHVYLVEGFKQEFENSAKSLRIQLRSSVFNELHVAVDMKRGQAELDRVKEKYTNEIEERVNKLIENCRTKHAQMTDEELGREFDDMWNETLKNLEFFKQNLLDIFVNVGLHLRENLRNKGSHACEELSKKSLKDCGLEPFKYTTEGWIKAKHQLHKWVKNKDLVVNAQNLAERIIATCQQFVTEKVERKNNYHETFILEILHIIDTQLNNDHMIKDMDFEVSLKQHICATAARQFQKMHEDFLGENDPYQCLNKNKDKFCADFKDVFNERDQCQKKAEEFTERCLKVAVEDFINRSLGPDIIGEMRMCREFSTRIDFQYCVLLDLHEKHAFHDYLRYTRSYDDYVKEWILQKILAHSSAVFEFEKKHIQSCVCNIKDAVAKAKEGESENVKSFVEEICKELGDKLIISKEALDTFMVLNNANMETFAFWLMICVDEMEQSIPDKEKNIKKRLQSLQRKPQDELFKKMMVCWKQCPFCQAPCEAAGRAHSVHFASLHRPQALGNFKWNDTGKLTTDICSTLVNSDKCFQSPATKGKWHSYKKYREIYPDWKIASDIGLDSSDYWKYMLKEFNSDLAELYQAEPADIPKTWMSIDKRKAEKSLKASFNIK